MWTAEEWSARPIAPSRGDEEEEDSDAPIAVGSEPTPANSAAAQPDVKESAPGPAPKLTLPEPSANSSAAETSAVITATDSGSARVHVGDQIVDRCDAAVDAALIQAAAPATMLSEPLVQADEFAADDTAAAQNASSVSACATAEQTAARVPDVATADQPADTDAALLAGHPDQPCAPAARAASAPKGLTVKERLATCIATERHRITFGKVRSRASARQSAQCCCGNCWNTPVACTCGARCWQLAGLPSSNSAESSCCSCLMDNRHALCPLYVPHRVIRSEERHRGRHCCLLTRCVVPAVRHPRVGPFRQGGHGAGHDGGRVLRRAHAARGR